MGTRIILQRRRGGGAGDMLVRMFSRMVRLVPPAIAFTILAVLPFAGAQSKRPAAVKSVRLYVLDCGVITGVSGAAFGFKDGDLATTDMVTPCFLIVHPRGTLMWDTGEIPDAAVKTDGTATKQGAFTVTRALLPQLAAIGYTPANITYMALSHYHGDHVANADAFAGTSTWIVQQVERDAMFAARPANEKKGAGAANPALYSALQHAKTMVIKNQDHDVFGDGTVVIKFTPGHTPGHQSLFLKLKNTGPVLLSGDLYHYPEEMTSKKVPSFDFDKAETMKSRAAMEEFVKANHAQLWIQHDATSGKTRKIAPEYYE
jgi:glyoxylase-like metal-dependent hydrolase (beta-lactamase superfamily II)